LTNENALTQRVTALKRSLADLRQRSIQYNIYQRDAATNRELYDALLQRYKEIGVAGAVESNNVAVVDPATSPRAPSSPRLSLNLGLFTLAGALLGAIAAAGLEQLDHGVTEPGEFEEKLGFPLLGMAPKSNGLAPLEALKKPRSDLAEAYLMVVANLELSTVQGAPRSLAVLSTRPREGKSATAIALAKSLARARRQVVLIDANLRAPSIHAAFGLSDVSGVSALLAGSDDIEAVLRSTEQAGLSIITAGADPSNPADLLVGDRLAKLVRALQERFDHVLVDGPSVGGFADALLVASAVQSVLYVVQAEAAPTSVVRAALGRLNPAQIAGGVLTMVKARRADRRDGRT
jgi:succinoglycan biosynthesis transport protein ExoP